MCIRDRYMVARAAELAQLSSTDLVLEVGIGSGYQAAVLSRLCARVIGIELVPELAERAKQTLAALNFDNVRVETGDGSIGLAAAAPYDAIIVAAGAPNVPHELVAQLKLGGRLVIPVGTEDLQTLSVITKTADGYEAQPY